MSATDQHVDETSLGRFLRIGIGDAERRLSRFVAGGSEGDGRLVALLESSRVVAVAASVYSAFTRAEAHSWTGAVVRRLRAAWHAMDPAVQRRCTGTTLITAAATHVALTVWQEAPAGWFWLILPGMVTSVGALLIVMSGGTVERSSHE